MLQVLMLFVLIITLIMYIWKKYSPYLRFPSYFFCNWHMILSILRGSGPQNKPLSVYIYKVVTDFCKIHFSEGLALIWFPEPIVIIYGTDAIKFFANEPSLVDKSWPYQLVDVLDKDGILRSSGKRAKRQRKLLSPAFYPSMMKNYVPILNDHALHFVHELGHLENQTAKDIGKIIKTSTIKLFCEAALGIKVGSESENRRINVFIKSITKVMEFVIYRLYRPWLHFDFTLNFSSEGRKHKQNVQHIHLIAKTIVEEMKELYDLHIRPNDHSKTDPCIREEHKKCFGDVLLEEQLKDPSFTAKDLETEIITLITGGYDTISYSLMWSIWLLGLHHDIQEKAYEEVTSISGEVINYEEIRNLPYLECIIKESLRIYPVAPFFGRMSKKDLYFEDYKIPRGTMMFFAPGIAHLNPEFYPNPEVFDPDRFLESKSHIMPWNFIPFAESVRSCIGKNYAMLEMKILLAHVIRNFKIVSLTPREDVEVCWEIMLKSSIPLSVKFIPR